MEVLLRQATPLYLCYEASKFCVGSFKVEEDNTKIYEFISKLIKKGHTSPLEHIVFSFSIYGISRAVLQELARHRMASLTVHSTRFALKKLFETANSNSSYDMIQLLVSDYVSEEVGRIMINTLSEVVRLAQGSNLSNDVLKYALPEGLKTYVFLTINARSLRNFINLRSKPQALKEIRILANKMLKCIQEYSEDYMVLFKDCAKKVSDFRP